MPAILNSSDLSALLDLSPDDVNALARKGVIKGYKIGKQWRFRAKEVNGFLDRQRDRMMADSSPFSLGRKGKTEPV
ncbi:MAG: DNA-binding protein [Deltaproteobacteria bacterium]|nr:MAG: DNA-binding protein [Deltaproteobacteria bacterium]